MWLLLVVMMVSRRGTDRVSYPSNAASGAIRLYSVKWRWIALSCHYEQAHTYVQAHTTYTRSMHRRPLTLNVSFCASLQCAAVRNCSICPYYWCFIFAAAASAAAIVEDAQKLEKNFETSLIWVVITEKKHTKKSRRGSTKRFELITHSIAAPCSYVEFSFDGIPEAVAIVVLTSTFLRNGPNDGSSCAFVFIICVLVCKRVCLRIMNVCEHCLLPYTTAKCVRMIERSGLRGVTWSTDLRLVVTNIVVTADQRRYTVPLRRHAGASHEHKAPFAARFHRHRAENAFNFRIFRIGR